MRLRPVVLMLVPVLGAGCLSIEYSLGSGGASDGGGAAGGGPMGGDAGQGGLGGAQDCSEIGACVAAPEGARVVRRLRDPGSCGGEILLGGVISESEPPFVAPGAVCECECTAPPSACGPMILELFGTGDCTGLSGSIEAPAEACTPISSASSIVVTNDSSPFGGCDASGSVELLPVEYDTPLALCDDGLAPCDGGVCVPTNAEVCITLPEGAECPLEFPVAQDVVMARSLEDTRSCDCSCGALTGVCNAGIEFYGDTACGEEPLNSLTGGACFASSKAAAINSAHYRPPISCMPLSTGSGAVTYTPSVLCCRS